MAVTDEKMTIENVNTVAKTPEMNSNTEVVTPPVSEDEERPHITFKTKMAIFVRYRPAYDG